MFQYLGPIGAFIICAVLIAAALYYFRVKDKDGFNSHPKFKNVPGGIYMVIAASLLFSLLLLGLSTCAHADEGKTTYVNWVEMYVGLDYDDGSVFCRDAAPSITDDDQTTSNLGFRLNLVEFEKGPLLFHTNAKYSHHSCAINQDKPSYNAPGIELNLRYTFGK